MIRSKKILLIFLLIFISSATVEVTAQCSMCRAVAESNLKTDKNQRGRGLNNAILYLMSVPYIMAGVGGYILWRNRKK